MPPPAPQPGAGAAGNRRFWLLAGVGGALALLLLSRPAGALLFGAGGLHIPVLNVGVPLAIILWTAPILLLGLWELYLRQPAYGRWRTPVAAGLGLLALLGCLRAQGVRLDLAGQLYTAAVATAGAVVYIRRLRARYRSIGGWPAWLRANWRLASMLLVVPVVFGAAVWVQRAFLKETVAFPGGRIAEMPRGVSRLDGANLRGANLSGAAVNGVELVSSDLRFIDLQGAELQATSFQRSRLQGARLGHAALTNVVFRGADLRGSELVGLTGKNVVLEEVDLRGARIEQLSVDGLRVRNANLRGVDLGGQSLAGIDFSGSKLEGARLAKAEAAGAKFNDAAMERVVLDGANLSGSELMRAELGGVSAARTNFQLAKLRGAHLEGADLSQADLRGADLSCADLRRARLPAREMLVAAVLDRALMSPADTARFGADARARKICFGLGAGRCSAAQLKKACPGQLR